MLQPDSTALSVIAWVVAILLVVGIAVFGHRFGRRSIGHAAGRLVGTLGVALAVVLAAVLTLNTQYGWYATWEDFTSSFSDAKLQGQQKSYGAKGRTPEQKKTVEHEADTENARVNAQYATQRAEFLRSLKVNDVGPDGRWVKITVPGIAMKGKDIGRVMVWLPPSYTSDPNRSYPVIEAFHGIPGGTLDYERVFHLDKALLTAREKHDVRDAIIIVPQEMPNGVDTECVDAGGLTMQTWLTKTVPEFVIHNLRADASRESWMALGVSAGGWCAAMAGMLTPDRYSGIVSLGGYFTPQFSNYKPFEKTGLPEQYDLIKRAAEHPTDQALWVLVSGADKTSGASSEAFTKAVRAPNTLTTVDYPHAGHRFGVWEKALPDVFSWAGKTLPEFSYAAGERADDGASPTAEPTPSSTSSSSSGAGEPGSTGAPTDDERANPGTQPATPAVPHRSTRAGAPGVAGVPPTRPGTTVRRHPATAVPR